MIRKLFISIVCMTMCLSGCSKQEEIIEEEIIETEDEVIKETYNAHPSTSGKLHVENTSLVDENNNPVQLKGVSSHGLSWFPQFINQEFITELNEDWNANVLRLAMYTAENGGYCTDGNQEELKKLVKNGVEYATNADLYAIIDWHILSDNDPNMHINESKAFFEEMSSTFKNSDNVIYEICNEPNGNTSWNDIKNYANEIIPIIRNNDKDALIIVGTPQWSQRVDEVAKSPLEFDNVLYALHFYAGTHKDDLRNKMERALQDGLPIFVSEYGICDASGNGALDKKEAEKWINTLNKYNISYIMWNLANKNESSSMIKEECTKTSHFELNDLNESGVWLYNLLNGKKQEYKEDETLKEIDHLKGSLILRNSWKEEDIDCFQYCLTLNNTSNTDKESWSYDIEFDQAFELKDSWNGKFSINGNVLHIENASYNGKIKQNDSVTDIGFIIKGNNLTIKG